MDAPVHGGAWVQCLWAICAQNGQPIHHCSEQEPRASWEDEAPLFWLRDAVQDGLIAPTFVATEDMAADIFTKSLDRLKVQKLTKMLGLGSIQECAALH